MSYPPIWSTEWRDHCKASVRPNGMNKSKHTPGRLDRNIPPASKYTCLYAGRNTHVCYLATTGKPEDEIESNANRLVRGWNLLADLEAAGITNPEVLPDLLAALVTCADWLSRSTRIDDREIADDARAAIAKAKGQS